MAKRKRPSAQTPDERRYVLMHAERKRALASNDPAKVRAWAATWSVPLLPCDDATLLASIAAANVAEGRVGAIAASEATSARLARLEAACARVAGQIVTHPRPVAEQLIRALESSEPTEPLRREMDRLIATIARAALAPSPQ